MWLVIDIYVKKYNLIKDFKEQLQIGSSDSTQKADSDRIKKDDQRQ